MIVNKNSWHYKIVTKWLFPVFSVYDVGNTLCKYFWQVVDRIILATMMFVFLNASFLCLGSMILGVKAGVVGFTATKLLLAWLLGLGVVSGIGAVVLGVGAIIYVVAEWNVNRKEARRDRIRLGLEKPKAPNLAVEFLKAKKSKICPLIEFVDDKEKDNA